MASSSPDEAPAASDVLASPSHEGTKPVGNTTTVDSHDWLRPYMEQWVENSEDSAYIPAPPVCMVMFPDLLERIWGWERLLPEVHASVPWHDYKSYLVEYLQKNALKVTTGKDALCDAVDRCIEAERRFVRICNRFLSIEEFLLTQAIKDRARDLVQSDGEYPAAAATLLAITAEAELMSEMQIQSFGRPVMRALAHEIRQAAFNLILCGGSESAAVTAVMVGLVEECKIVLDALREDPCSALRFVCNSASMRQGILNVLTKLAQEPACQATGNAGTLTSATKKLMGENGNKEASNVVEDSGHALKIGEIETKDVPFLPDN